MSQNHPFRTNKTWLRDDDLTLLDVLFDRNGVAFSCLIERIFGELWNLGYSHQLNDDELHARLGHLLERGVLDVVIYNASDTSFRMTEHGGELWSEERCPIWERFYSEQGVETSGGRELTSVFAVSRQILSDYLRLSPQYPLDNSTDEIKVIPDYGLIRWHRFPQLYSGIRNDAELPNRWNCSEYDAYTKHCDKYQARRERDRSWWGSVRELQKFTPR